MSPNNRLRNRLHSVGATPTGRAPILDSSLVIANVVATSTPILQLIAEDTTRTRAAMLRMHDDGLIALPPPCGKRPDQRVRISVRSDPRQLLEKPAHVLMPLLWHRVRDKSESRLWNEFGQRYHSLRLKPLPGAQLRYLVYSAGQPIALLGFGVAAWMSEPLDRDIGWTHEQRKRHLLLPIAANSFSNTNHTDP